MYASIFEWWIVAVWIDYSNDPQCVWLIEITEEQVKLVEMWYKYNLETKEFEETELTKEIILQKKTERMNEIVMMMWQIKQEIDWLELLDEPTEHLTNKLKELKSEYLSLKK